MKTRKEILERLKELAPEMEIAKKAYFLAVEEKQKGEIVSEVDFLKIESEYELIRKEIESLKWVINIDSREKDGDESALSHQEG